jgi:hypothetical protein
VQLWSAGPHLFIADHLIWVFTALGTRGVHSPSWNAIWWVELVGDYSTEDLSVSSRKRNPGSGGTLRARRADSGQPATAQGVPQYHLQRLPR